MSFKENENKQFINLERRQIKILSGYGRKTAPMLNCETWKKKLNRPQRRADWKKGAVISEET